MLQGLELAYLTSAASFKLDADSRERTTAVGTELPVVQ